ncbi:MAG TPA: ester cyclase [Gemmatimonadota bacterium]
MTVDANKAIIRRYYEELWNQGKLELAEELIAHDIAFRGSLSTRSRGIEAFKAYVRMVKNAFPDFHNVIEDLIAEGDKVVARLTHRGTHRGEVLFGSAPTGMQVSFPGIAIFRLEKGKIADGWVVGDILVLMRQLAVGPMLQSWE